MAADQKMQIFRRTDAPGLNETGLMAIAQMTPEQREGLTKMMKEGYGEGDDVKVLVNLPGFSLTYAWLKKSSPLLLHSHDSDCLYYIVAGTLQMGTESLGAGDSFFVPGDSAYSYVPGPEGVEVLEFRHNQSFDFKNLTKNQAFYDKGAATVAAVRDDWRTAKRPSMAT